jgi:hypothetical protein
MKFKQTGYFSTLLAIAILPTALLFNSCKHDGIPPDQLPQICFTEQVLPIFQNSCGTTGCHNGGGGGESRLSFTDYAGIMNAITPGNPDKSKAYQSMISQFQLMPPNNALPIAKRSIIRLWIEQGALETTCTTPTTSGSDPGSGTTKSGTSWACYTRDIQPILLSSCAVSGCHDAITHKEGVDFSSYSKTILRIKSGSPGTSSLYNSITSNPGSENFMPPKPYSPLSKTAIDSIYSWIKRGGLNEECATTCDTTGTIDYAGHIKPIIDLNCVSCHGANSPSAGITLLTAANVQAVAQTGKLLGAVQRKSGFIAMPAAYSLSTCDVKQIELWIKLGYK